MNATESQSIATKAHTLGPSQGGWPLKRILNGILVVCLFVVTFICGSVFGGMTASNKFAKCMRHYATNPQEHVSVVLEQLKLELSLSAQQMEQVEPLVREHFTNMKKTREALIPKVLTEHETFEKKVAQHLKADQQAIWHDRCEWVRDHCYRQLTR